MREKIVELVVGVIGEVNADLGYDELKSPTLGTELYGNSSSLDSLSLVMLVSAIESAISEKLGQDVVLASEKAMSMRNSPYRTVGSLVEFIEAELAGR